MKTRHNFCIMFGRNTVRETVDGVLCYRCECGHVEPLIRRSDAERAKMVTMKPAHERYRVLRQVFGFRRRA